MYCPTIEWFVSSSWRPTNRLNVISHPSLSTIHFHFLPHSEVNCLEEVTTICAMLSAESIWITPPPPAREARFGNKSAPVAPSESRLQMNFKSYGNNYPSGGANQGRNGGFSSLSGGNSGEESERARLAHAALSHPYGDFHTYLHVYNTWESHNRSVQWCERNFVNFRSMKTVASIRYVCNISIVCICIVAKTCIVLCCCK